AQPDRTPARTWPSGNVHGMRFAVALGLADDPFPAALRGSVDGRSAVLVAIRSVDSGEKENIKAAGLTAITMADIDRLGMGGAMEKAIAVASRGNGIHLSLDMDAIDPDEAPGVGTPVRGGLTDREAELAMEVPGASGKPRPPASCRPPSPLRPGRSPGRRPRLRPGRARSQDSSGTPPTSSRP